MGLIPSPRHTRADLEAWSRWEHLDEILAADPRLGRAADRARAVIEEFVDAGPCHVGISWGKDSTVLAHLVATSAAAARAPLVWARADRWESPDCDLVRDEFLRRYPDVRYEERTYTWRVPLRPEPGWDDPANSQDALREVLGDGRYVSGVRAAEARKRRVAMAAHGEATGRTCRPVGWWRDDQVWAYLHAHDLPVHPAYACTYGGALDRSRVRVHALRTVVGDAEWEDTYYPCEVG